MKKTTFLAIAVAGVLGVALMWFDNPLKLWLTPKVAPVAEWFGRTIGSKVEAIKADPVTFATVAAVPTITIFGLAAKAYGNWKAKSQAALNQSRTAESEANATALATQQKLNEAEAKIEVYEKDGDAVTAIKNINTELQASNNQLTTERNIAQTNYKNLLTEILSDPTMKAKYEKYIQT